MKKLIFAGLFLIFTGSINIMQAQIDTEFWFVVPDLSHRGNTGGTPGVLRFASLEEAAIITVSMPANPYHSINNPDGFKDTVFTVPANDDYVLDLTYLIDVATNPDNNSLENKALTVDGINDFGLYITSSSLITAVWEIHYDYGSDLWSLKGSNGMGTLFYTPFQTTYDNRALIPHTCSAIDLVSTSDNNDVTITLPAGVAASYGSVLTSIPAGGTLTIHLDMGQTFSLFPYNYSVSAGDRLAGTRIESTQAISVTVKDDALNTGSTGQPTIGDQLVPVDKIGDSYIAMDYKSPNHVYVLATEDNTNIFVNNAEGTAIGASPYLTLDQGEQGLVIIPSGSKFAHITSRTQEGDSPKPFYTLQLNVANQTRAATLLPPLGCSGSTRTAFTRARDGENIYSLFIVARAGSENSFLVDGLSDNTLIDPGAFTPLIGSDGWVALLTSSMPASKLPVGQHLIENTESIFHLAVTNGFPGAGQGGFYYGFHTNYHGLESGALIAGTEYFRDTVCYGAEVEFSAFGGTSYSWSPATYLDTVAGASVVASDLPVGLNTLQVEITNPCGIETYEFEILVLSPPANGGPIEIDERLLCFNETASILYPEVTRLDVMYNWDFDGGTVVSGSNNGAYIVNWDSPGIKNISCSIIENGCISEESSDVIEVYQPLSEFQLESAVCAGEQANVEFLGSASQDAVFNWDFNEAEIISGSGEGPYVLSWQNPGTKQLTLAIDDHGCFSDLVIHNIENHAFPTVGINAPDHVCFNTAADISYQGSGSPDAVYIWDFQGGEILSGTSQGPYQVRWDTPGTKYLSLTVEENACSSYASFDILVPNPAEALQICMLTVDDDNHNVVMWENQGMNPLDKVIIYKETSVSDVFESIGVVSATTTPVFADLESNPAQNSSRYMISVLDTCGYETAQSSFHKTMHLTISLGTGGVRNLIWDAYEGFDYSTFHIYRGANQENMVKIAEQASNTFTYSDLNHSGSKNYYQIEVLNPDPCEIAATKSTAETYSSTRSNIVDSGEDTGLELTEQDAFSLWPNPANNTLYFRTTKQLVGADFSIINMNGQQVYSGHVDDDMSEADISGFNAGVYIFVIEKDMRIIRRKFMVL